MREIWMLQPRFERRTGRTPYALLEHIRLRAGYDFLLLRCDAGELPAELGDWWTEFLDAAPDERAALIARASDSGEGSGPRKRRRRSRGRGRPDGPDSSAAAPGPADRAG
jgi:poly(A) polymerase